MPCCPAREELWMPPCRRQSIRAEVHTSRGATEQPNSVSSVRTRDGLDLRTYRWPALGAARAHLLLVHGIAEHAGRYPHVASQLAQAGIATHSYDQRGFGGSGGHRAYLDRWSQYHDDLEDRLAVHRTTARRGVALFREQDRVKRKLANGGPLPVTTYVLHGADDPIVPEWASRSLEGRANVTRRVYPGLHHETHNEPGGAAVIGDTIAWIADQVTR